MAKKDLLALLEGTAPTEVATKELTELEISLSAMFGDGRSPKSDIIGDEVVWVNR